MTIDDRAGEAERFALAAHVIKHFAMSVQVVEYGDIELGDDEVPELLAEQRRLLNYTFSGDFTMPDAIGPVTWYDEHGAEYYGGADELGPDVAGCALMVLAAQSLALQRELEETRRQFGALLFYSFKRGGREDAEVVKPNLRVVT